MSRFIYRVEVTADTPEQADQVMAERIDHDEDYGFDYTVDFASAPVSDTATFEQAVEIGRWLKSVDGENPEYDRALVELIRDLFGLGSDDEGGREVAAIALGIGGTDESVA